MSTEIATPKKSVIQQMAMRFDIEPKTFYQTLKSTVMPANTAVSDDQICAFLLVAKQYDLNPFTKEIYAFPNKGGIQPIVSIDGWLKIINEQPQFDGMTFKDELDKDGKLISITCQMFRKDRSNPIVVTEYMSECKRNTDPWNKFPTRMLRHKATIQAGRYSFGLSGIMELDEAERMKDIAPSVSVNVSDIEAEILNDLPVTPKAQEQEEAVDAENVEPVAQIEPEDEYISQAQINEIIDLLQATKTLEADYCNHIKVDCLESIKATMYEKSKELLVRKYKTLNKPQEEQQ